MPRWNRRERPDYRYLRDVTDEAALVNAIRSPTYGEGHDFRLLAGFQARLTAMWGDRGLLPIGELVAAHEAVRAADAAFFGHGRNWQGAFLHDAVGNLVGWGLRLGILAEEPASEGTRGFRMVRRDPLFERMGNGQYRRLDAEGMREKSARGAGQREAARVRHAEEIAGYVRHHVGMLCEKGAAIPEAWFRFTEFARFKGQAERVADARPTFEEAHRGMHLADQKAWFKVLQSTNFNTPFPRPKQEDVQVAAVPDEDAEALGSLSAGD